MCTVTGGLRLLSGAGAVVLGAGVAHALHFLSYEETKKIAVKLPFVSQSVASGIAGGIATLASDAIMTPFDMVKQVCICVHSMMHRGCSWHHHHILQYGNVFVMCTTSRDCVHSSSAIQLHCA